jgi:hypothetical protein
VLALSGFTSETSVEDVSCLRRKAKHYSDDIGACWDTSRTPHSKAMLLPRRFLRTACLDRQGQEVCQPLGSAAPSQASRLGSTAFPIRTRG